MNALAVTDLVSGYGRAAPIVRGVSLAFSSGTISTVIGPNGAGKSTLLKTISGLVPVRAGRITVGHRSLEGEDATARVRAGVALCAQGRANFPDLTVAENVRLGAYGLPRRQVAERLAWVRANDPVTDKRWKDRVSDLSGGQQQSVEISMALVSDPSVLLLDEPSLGLAPGSRADVFQRIRQIADSGVCVLVVEQNVAAAVGVSDRLIVLDQGTVLLDGPPAAVLENDDLRTVYLGARATRAEPPAAR
ncbi:ABC transporter ATP-binding protein [Micromonospora sp. NPDC000316]|uniref:ABC transporter ATP-binding protein n=1 Tax=Micromonospora sp. NPDC000316 TaxID=3364216 RepID=UPI0036C8EE1B